ncbi:RNA-guided endonuclease InsQ/TnpB family protein [Thermus caldilimi]|uniref:RNA-guided endonuclease InsQ/TnpB family protein n=1 Tax=Thermus caldilimi TaxID=2483360 RepID=UPI001F0E0612|nr:helix-turn-helix domain-containing protein [Thermus caldilimi]
MLKAFKYRLYPTRPQARDLERTLELCRQLYNAALQERRDAYRKAGKAVGFYEQKRHLPVIRRDLPEYKGIHSQVLQEVIQRVDRAFQGFFRRVKQGQKPGYLKTCTSRIPCMNTPFPPQAGAKDPKLPARP